MLKKLLMSLRYLVFFPFIASVEHILLADTGFLKFAVAVTVLFGAACLSTLIESEWQEHALEDLAFCAMLGWLILLMGLIMVGIDLASFDSFTRFFRITGSMVYLLSAAVWLYDRVKYSATQTYPVS